MKKLIATVTMIAVMVSFVGCAGASLTKNTVKNKQARVIYFVDKSVSEDKIKEKLRDAVSLRVDDITENEGLMPEELPDTPQKPKINEQYKKLMAFTGQNGMNAAMQYTSLDVSNAWYSVSGEGGMTSEFNNRAEYYKAAVYPYKEGYKVYIYEFYSEGTDGIMGNITNAAVEAVVGNEGALLYMAQVRDKFLEALPEAKIIKQSPSKLAKINLNAIGWDTNNKK